MFFFEDQESLDVINGINDTQLESIAINGLFGRSDVVLKFDKQVNIYVGENGLGKTTILNCVYYIIHGDYDKLADIDFDTIGIKLKDEEIIIISKADVVKYISKDRPKDMTFAQKRIDQFIETFLENYKEQNIIYSFSQLQAIIVSRLVDEFDISPRAAYHYLDSMFEKRRSSDFARGNKEKIVNLQHKLHTHIEERIIYLTTYRRIEKDFSNYFRNERSHVNFAEDDMLIRFGMKDVADAVDRILETIRISTNQEFNTMTGVLLSKYAKGDNQNNKNSLQIEEKQLQIVLNRLGTKISSKDKKHILSIVSNSDIYSQKYQNLLEFLSLLIDNYEKLKKYDEKIIHFANTCNKYLTGKEFRYNQSDLSLKVVLEDSDNKPISLSMLSSGEKQIVSLFSKLYLENDEKCILIIDEPELSISMHWQKMLLPDIMRSGNCKLLLTVTHSPFIFQNEFDSDAKDMWYCLKKRKKVVTKHAKYRA